MLKSEGTFPFTVDAALLQELGERLVGRAHVALGELIKNAYDADARKCEIVFSEDEIILSDDGHGMTSSEFRRFWMRVGTTHKAAEGHSRLLQRPFTGSKGVGRLAVQFLARSLKIETRAEGETDYLVVNVDWPKAVKSGELIQATVDFEVHDALDDTFAGGSAHGTKITLSGLNHHWDAAALKSVALEIWELVPPYDDAAQTDPRSFKVEVSSTSDVEIEQGFSKQLQAALKQWIARIDGEIILRADGAYERVDVTFRTGESYHELFPISEPLIDRVTWEIKVYNLRGRLAENVPVKEARDYLESYGGVHVYDGAFRLPYYGTSQDWLNLEYDHSHRKVKSKLLPDSFHVERALNDLPTQGRLFGAVRINTGAEGRAAASRVTNAGEYLKIQVTRDRLVANAAYDQLRDAVRRSIDYYATRTMLLRIQKASVDRPLVSPSEQVKNISSVLASYESSMPAEVYSAVRSELSEFVDSAHREQEYNESIQQLLGPLASAGLAAIALEHETSRELIVLRGIASQIESIAHGKKALLDIVASMRAWIDQVHRTRELFAPLMSQEDREQGHRLLIGKVIERVSAAVAVFTPGVELSLAIPNQLRFPRGSVADWSAITQNVIINAANALAEVRGSKKIWISAGEAGKTGWLKISDNGPGIDLSLAQKLFDPFRRDSARPGRAQLGLGGLGLGLTIVRMIAENRGCTVSFVEPVSPFRTTFELSWKV